MPWALGTCQHTNFYGFGSLGGESSAGLSIPFTLHSDGHRGQREVEVWELGQRLRCFLSLEREPFKEMEMKEQDNEMQSNLTSSIHQ